MIRRLYVDNFKSLVEFEWQPLPETLVLGVNGSGKTAALDAIDIIRTWACDWPKNERWFDEDDLTLWREDKVARFEIDLEFDGARYEYVVKFDFEERDKLPRARVEVLNVDGHNIFARDREGVSVDIEANMSTYPIPRTQSAISLLAALTDADKVKRFRWALEEIINVRPLPHLMGDETQDFDQRPDPHFENFATWYLTVALPSQIGLSLPELMTGVWPEFDHIKLEPISKSRMALSLVFNRAPDTKQALELPFRKFSDGERMLVLLYTLAAYQLVGDPKTIILDEPDNFLALAELQPWLIQLLDGRQKEGQIILVSHNAEIVNTMGEHRVALFERENHFSKTVVRSIEIESSGLSLSERITRGWLSTSPMGQGTQRG
jgi:ABC-type uncharacterized transport system ATPase subunit